MEKTHEQPSITLALLMFNEKENIEAAIDDTLDFGAAHLRDYELLVIDDGSTDGSADIARERLSCIPGTRVVSHGRNRGMGAGIRSVIQNATKDYFVFNAADGQIEANEIARLLPLLGRVDIPLSTYENRRETMARELVSRSFRAYLRLVAGIRFELPGLYLFPTAPAKEIEPLVRAETFFFSFELIQRGLERGLSTEVTQMRCRPRAAGSSKVFNARRIARVGREALRYGIAKRLG